MSGWMQPSYHGRSYGVFSASNFGNDGKSLENLSRRAITYYENLTEYNFTYYGDWGVNSPEVQNYGSIYNGFDSLDYYETKRLLRTLVTICLELAVIIMLIIVFCCLFICKMKKKRTNTDPETHGNFGSQGYTQLGSAIPRGAVTAVVGKNNGQAHQDQYGNSFEDKKNIRHTVISAHDNGDPVSCLSANTDAPTSVLVG